MDTNGVGTCEDLITAGRNGFIFRSRDAVAIARYVVETLADEARLAEMGKRSHEVAHANDFHAGVASLVQKLDELRAARA